jgi:uncharacterized repeat protein (TIGR02543 family)
MLRTIARRALPAVAIGWLAVAAVHGTAQANPMCDSVTPALGDTVLCEYDAGGATTITVPPGTIGIDITLNGGGGGAGGTAGSRGYGGGSGAQVRARISRPTAGSLTVVVGGGGGSKGAQSGGTGGGFSAIYDGIGVGHASVIAVAGGGGGGGYGTRCDFVGRGGQGGFGDAGNGAGGNGDGGDAPGRGGDGSGPGGLGGAVPPSLTGTAGFTGSAWSAGGAGGASGTARGGNGGDGYGGGGGGGLVNPASPITCPQNSPGDAVAANDGSGGGAGGSYVKPAHQLGLPEYDNSGGTAGGLSGQYWQADGVAGSVILSFLPTYTVTYDGNGATGGPVPTDHVGPYLGFSSVTVCDDHRTDANCDFPNDERLTRVGYTFDGWNTAANGTGTSYAPSSTFSISSNTVLYAQWKAVPPPTTPSASTTTTGASSAPAATPALRTTKPKTTAAGATVTFTAPGPGTATAAGTAAQATRAGVTVCSGSTKVRKAGKAVVVCKLNATGRRLRAKGALTVVLTTTFVAKAGTRLQSASTVVFARRG